jgi:hypothetical protein
MNSVPFARVQYQLLDKYMNFTCICMQLICMVISIVMETLAFLVLVED